jgi:hypothetical protein
MKTSDGTPHANAGKKEMQNAIRRIRGNDGNVFMSLLLGPDLFYIGCRTLDMVIAGL